MRWQFGDAYQVFDAVVPRAVSAAESPASGTSVFSYDGQGKAAEAFARLAEEVLRHG